MRCSLPDKAGPCTGLCAPTTPAVPRSPRGAPVNRRPGGGKRAGTAWPLPPGLAVSSRAASGPARGGDTARGSQGARPSHLVGRGGGSALARSRRAAPTPRRQCTISPPASPPSARPSPPPRLDSPSPSPPPQEASSEERPRVCVSVGSRRCGRAGGGGGGVGGGFGEIGALRGDGVGARRGRRGRTRVRRSWRRRRWPRPRPRAGATRPDPTRPRPRPASPPARPLLRARPSREGPSPGPDVALVAEGRSATGAGAGPGPTYSARGPPVPSRLRHRRGDLYGHAQPRPAEVVGVAIRADLRPGSDPPPGLPRPPRAAGLNRKGTRLPEPPATRGLPGAARRAASSTRGRRGARATDERRGAPRLEARPGAPEMAVNPGCEAPCGPTCAQLWARESPRQPPSPPGKTRRVSSPPVPLHVAPRAVQPSRSSFSGLALAHTYTHPRTTVAHSDTRGPCHSHNDTLPQPHTPR